MIKICTNFSKTSKGVVWIERQEHVNMSGAMILLKRKENIRMEGKKQMCWGKVLMAEEVPP